MEETNLLESLLVKAQEYSKTSVELFKLQALEKTSDVLSSMASRVAGISIFLMCFLMGTIGIALWLGEILGKSWYGFFAIAAFYGLAGVIIYFLMHKWLKKLVGNFFVKQALK